MTLDCSWTEAADPEVSCVNNLPVPVSAEDETVSAPLPPNFGPKVRNLLLAGLFEQTTIAHELGMSAATLRRRLAAEGTSFREIRFQVLSSRAKELLHGNLSVAAIAQQLGFSDVRSFNRAFKSWAGKTPAAWRSAFRDPSLAPKNS